MHNSAWLDERLGDADQDWEVGAATIEAWRNADEGEGKK